MDKVKTKASVVASAGGSRVRSSMSLTRKLMLKYESTATL